MLSQAPSMLPNALHDYRIHFSDGNDHVPVKIQTRPSGCSNPANWPTKYRRVPPYRPVNRHLDLAERPNGSTAGEYIFVNVMLNGVRLNSLFVTSYEATLGKAFPQLVRYKIGGEW